MHKEVWKRHLGGLSGNLTTNAAMPDRISDLLLEEDLTLKDKIFFEEISFPKFDEKVLNDIRGLNIISGLQNLARKDYLTVFRAVRFPTYKRIYEVLSETGFSISNFEQERILALYTDDEYVRMRSEIQKDFRFWVVPQERVVKGMPVFTLVNDALQIHRAFRDKEDKVLIIAIHVPRNLIESKQIRLIANAAIDLEYQNTDRDFEIHHFEEKDGVFKPDYAALRAQGIELHEMYSKDLPIGLDEAKKLGIEQDFFLLHLYEIEDLESSHKLFKDTQLLIENAAFLHGFFGDQNIFGRRRSKHLPYKCERVLLV